MHAILERREKEEQGKRSAEKIFTIPPKKVKGEDGYRVFSVRLREELIAELEEIAGITGYSRNGIISLMLNDALKRYGK